ncbi:MAG: O-antigen ligase family protein [Deltaproteobacteria bacterium]|nr:MAG: O-antigen ligase family protein [Deltaproteobacteria bacterium]
MMTPGSQKKMSAPQGHSVLWFVLLGIILGLAFMAITQLRTRWFLFVFASGLMIPVILALKDRRRFLLAFLVMATPINLSKTFMFTPSDIFRTVFGFSIYLSYLPILGLYFIWIYRWIFWHQRLTISKVGLFPLFGLFIISALSVGVAGNRLFAAFDLFALAFMGLTFIYISSDLREERDLRLVLVVLIFTGFVQATIAIGQGVTGSSLGLEIFGARKFITGFVGLETLSRVTGTLGHPSSMAEYFDLVIPVSFAMLFYPMSRSLKILLGLGVFFQIIGQGMSYSRGGIFWTMVAVGAIFLLQICRRMGVMRGAFLATALASLAVILLLTIPNPLQKGLFRTEAATAYGRLPLMKVAKNVIAHHPFLGVGLNNYVQAAKKYDSTPEQLTTGWNTAVHNVYLFIAGEVGLIGLIFFVWLLIKVLWHLLPALYSPDPLIGNFGLGIMSGLLALMLHWMTDLGSWPNINWFWFMLGLAVAVGNMAAKQRAESVPAGQTAAAG